MVSELDKIGAYELYFNGMETYTLRFIDLMKSGECFQGNNLQAVIDTAVKYAKNPKWLNEEIPTPKKYITQPKRRPTTLAVDVANWSCEHCGFSNKSNEEWCWSCKTPRH